MVKASIMKKTINVGIASRNFIIDEDAYSRLESYLKSFRAHINNGFDAKEVMEELEGRIAELFQQELSSENSVVSLALIEKVISQLGMPDGSTAESSTFNNTCAHGSYEKPKKKLYRDSDDKVISGVCSGLSVYFEVDVVLLRVIFVALLMCASFGFWAYIIFLIAAPLAKTAAQKCEMRGLEPTAENMAKFTNAKI
jgi:phage shock protein PspC (stress-responsive transcriptional regulator)